MHYASKLRVIVCSSLENIAHPGMLSHRTPQQKTLAFEMQSKKKKKKKKKEGTKGGRKGGGQL